MSSSGPGSDLYVGTISGTSVDGLDIALLEIKEQLRVLAATTTPFPEDLRNRLLSAAQPGTDDLDVLGGVDRELGEFIGDAVRRFLKERGYLPQQIAAVGSHGQTVRHRPALQSPFTWQIGDPNMIAEITGITTVADFRRRDMAAGGEGAPLVPPFHAALFRNEMVDRVIVNIGGISNITLLPKDVELPIRGFDTGPGNGLMDSWCQQHRHEPFDENGNWAATGEVEPELLLRLKADPYFSRRPPKSTGREQFNLEWLNPLLAGQQNSKQALSAAQVQRTLLELTAGTIVDAIHRWSHGCEQIILCGGGRHNSLLRQRISDLAQAPVTTSEDHGHDGDSIEAATFAWLAMCRLKFQSGNSPQVTGAAGGRVLGGVYAP